MPISEQIRHNNPIYGTLQQNAYYLQNCQNVCIVCEIWTHELSIGL